MPSAALLAKLAGKKPANADDAHDSSFSISLRHTAERRLYSIDIAGRNEKAPVKGRRESAIDLITRVFFLFSFFSLLYGALIASYQRNGAVAFKSRTLGPGETRTTRLLTRRTFADYAKHAQQSTRRPAGGEQRLSRARSDGDTVRDR